jgi:hypothetical protein
VTTPGNDGAKGVPNAAPARKIISANIAGGSILDPVQLPAHKSLDCKKARTEK